VDAVPDWTWVPLGRPLLRATGQPLRRGLSLAGRLASLPKGPALMRLGFGDDVPPEAATYLLGVRVRTPVGVRVQAPLPGGQLLALRAIGAGVVATGPPAEVDGELVLVHAGPGRALEVVRGLPSGTAAAVVVERAELPEVVGSAVPILAAVPDRPADVREALAAGANGVYVRHGLGSDLSALRTAAGRSCLAVESPTASPAEAAAVLEAGADVVVLRDGLVDYGPGLVRGATEHWVDRRRGARPLPAPTLLAGWVAAVVVGVGMLAAAAGAAAIALGPVLLAYDEDFLGLTRTELGGISSTLVAFLQHDRITLAGTMASIGVLYLALAIGMRQGWPWARRALLVSGTVGFASFLLFLGYGYLDPLHGFASASLLPFFLWAVTRPLPQPTWRRGPEPPDDVRRRGLLGQLLLVTAGVGLVLGGAVISVIGISGVFVATDLVFLQTTPGDLRAADPRLMSFIAHDRAGFGGALVSHGLAVLGLTAWGFRPGARWVWWSLAVAAVPGFAATVAVHLAVGYNDAGHLAPVAVAAAFVVSGLALSRRYLLGVPASPVVGSPSPRPAVTEASSA
jgi:hypothetical protein